MVSAADLTGQDGYRVIGPATAPLEITIYSDFECPYCRNFALAALPAIVAEFADRGLLRIRFAYFPLAAIHPNAISAAKAAHCAGQAGRFWAYHDYIFVRQPEWAGEKAPDSLWIGYAESLGLPRAQFAACLKAEETDAVIEADLRQALLAGATGTPTVVLDGESITGLTSYEELRRTILDALARAGFRSNAAPPGG
jgi:protein-disulfide isomerase